MSAPFVTFTLPLGAEEAGLALPAPGVGPSTVTIRDTESSERPVDGGQWTVDKMKIRPDDSDLSTSNMSRGHSPGKTHTPIPLTSSAPRSPNLLSVGVPGFRRVKTSVGWD